jgi:hypothetical protein
MNPVTMFLLSQVVAVAATGHAMAAEQRSETATAKLLAVEIPHPGAGTLATVRSLGPNRPSEPSLLVISRPDESRAAENAHPDEARWRTPQELIVDSFDRPVRNGSGTRITRVDTNGREIGEIFDRAMRVAPRPSPDGRWLALTAQHATTGKQRLEIYDLGGGDQLGEPRVFRELPPYNLAWSPDGKYIAVGVGIVEPTGKVWPRLRILDVAAGTIRSVNDGGRPDGVRPLFWTEEGLFVESEPGIRRCDLDGAGCVVHYDVGYPRFRARAGTPIGNGKAWILVTDFARDAFEVRGHELHEIDLVNGGGRRLLRLPDGIFLNDISWIAD